MTMEKKQKVISILKESFKNNGSIEFVVGNKPGKEKRLTRLLDYSYEKGLLEGNIILSDDENSCCIYLDSSKKSGGLRSIILDLKLVFGVIGFSRLSKVLKREGILKKCFPSEPYIHIWYIGVNPSEQGKGLGTELMKYIISENVGKQIYLETSNPRNIPFYTRLGFIEKDDLKELGYPLKTYLKQ